MSTGTQDKATREMSYSQIFREQRRFFAKVGAISILLLVCAAAAKVGKDAAWLTPYTTGKACLELIGEILGNAGVGGLVAAIFGVTIDIRARRKAINEEERSRRQHQQQIKELEKGHVEIRRDVFKYLLAVRLDDSMKSQLFEQINYMTRYTRSGLYVQYSFEKLDDPELSVKGFLIVDVLFRYRLHNITEHEMTDPIFHVMETYFPSNHPLEGFQNLDVRDCAGGDLSYPSPALIEPCLERHDPAEPRKLKFTTAPVVIPGNKAVRVQYHYRAIQRMADTRVWLSSYPADGIEIRMQNFERLGLEVWVESVHSDEFKRIPAGPNCTFELKAGILPYNGFIVSWRQAPPEGVVITPAGTEKANSGCSTSRKRGKKEGKGR